MEPEFNPDYNLTFDEWFDIFADRVKDLQYTGPIDKQSFESDFDISGETPENTAVEFVKEMNS